MLLITRSKSILHGATPKHFSTKELFLFLRPVKSYKAKLSPPYPSQKDLKRRYKSELWLLNNKKWTNEYSMKTLTHNFSQARPLIQTFTKALSRQLKYPFYMIEIILSCAKQTCMKHKFAPQSCKFCTILATYASHWTWKFQQFHTFNKLMNYIS